MICICKNKGADQLCGYCEADVCLCFCYTDCTIPLLLKSKISSFFSDCTGWFVSGQEANPYYWFSHAWQMVPVPVWELSLLSRPGLILIVNHDYFYSIEIFFNQKLFCNRRFLRLKLILFLFEYFSKMHVIMIDFMNKLRLNSKMC